MSGTAPETQFTELDGDRIALQPSGECIDLRWDWPPYADWLESLGTMARVISFDVRGSGASDTVTQPGVSMWERWADETRAVMDATNSKQAVRDALRTLGVEIRAGVHTGEVEVRGDDVAGIGVHIAARVMSCAQDGEVWVSAAVPMLVAGSGLEFLDQGERDLKGVPGSWRVLSLVETP